MTIFTFLLGIVFVVAGLGGIVASINLLPTELGLLYAGSGVLAVCAGGVMLAIGALIRRLGALRATIERAQGREGWQTAASVAESWPAAAPAAEEVALREGEAPALDAAAAPTAYEPEPAVASEIAPEDALPLEEEDAVNENRSGHLPTMAQIEHALIEPEAAPTLVGRYSAGGANYMIFSDGSIEAETEEGAFKFASMSEFKAYLAGPRA